MFWKLSFLQPCAIDSLLDKEDCTLDEILDEDDVLQECKTNNKKLTDFLAQPVILEQLVRMVCFEPNEDVADKVKFKYPHLACEVLTCGVMSIVEQLVTTPSLLDMLWAFLDTTEPLNPLLASFISKVLGMLLEKQQSVIMYYVRAKEDFLTKYLRHLGTSAIMDLLLRMVNGNPGANMGRSELSLWLEEQGLVDRLVDFIKADTDAEQCVNASLTLCEMIRLSRENTQDSYQSSSDPNQQQTDPAPLHAKLESKDTIERLLNNVFSSENPSNGLVISGLSVLLVILTDNVFSEPGMLESVMDSVPSEEKVPPPGIANLLEIIVPWLTKFHALLKQAPEISRMNTTVGVLDPPLGNVRLQIVKLMSALLSKATSAIAAEIVVLDIFSTLIDLFFAYPWNNFLHMQVELCVRSVLNSSHPLDSTTTASMSRPRDDLTAVDTETETRSEISEESQAALKSLTSYLLKDCQFVCKLLDGVTRNEELSRDNPGSRRQGYMGHLIRMSNTLVKFGEVSDQLTLSMDDSTRQRWNNFVNGPLAEMNKRNETNLGGNQAVSLNMDDSDEDFEQNTQDSELEKAYHQYLDLKYCTNYREDYGVEDELTAAEEPFEASFTRLMDITRVITADEEQSQASLSLFEAACSDRIQQFDDEEESEEEEEEEAEEDDSMWADKDANLASPMDHHSISSDDDDEFISRREFPTGESFEGVSSKRSPPRKPPPPHMDQGHEYPIITQITSVSTTSDPDKMEIESPFTGMWRDVADKSGAASEDVPMENADWTKEPDAPKPMSDDQNADSNWADFSKFSSTFGANSIQPQGEDRDERSEEGYGVSSSHITVTYRANSHPEDDEDDFLEPIKRPDTSKYDPLSPGKKDDGTGESSSAMNYDDSYNSDEDEDVNSSSDSDEDRTGSYNLNTTQGSEGEELINSLNDSREQEIATLSPSHSTANSAAAVSQDTPPSSSNSSSEGESSSSTANRHDTADTNDSGTSPDTPSDGPADDMELQDNYKFLSKGLLSHSGSESSGSGGNGSEEMAVEQKRAEAHEACSVYTNEVSGTTSIET